MGLGAYSERTWCNRLQSLVVALSSRAAAWLVDTAGKVRCDLFWRVKEATAVTPSEHDISLTTTYFPEVNRYSFVAV